MTSLRVLAALVLAAVPLASQELLFNETLLNLEGLAHEGDRFGTSVAVGRETPCIGQPESVGRILVVGAAQAGTKGTRSGAVHVFVLRDGQRERVSDFPETAPDTTAFDAYGFSVALSGNGNVIAIGAPLHDSANGNAGAVYVWERPCAGQPWILTKLTGPDAGQNDELGTSVALSNDGQILVAGAPQPNPQPNPAEAPTGKVYVFKRGTGAWPAQPAAVHRASSGQPFDFFGFAVAVNSNGAAVAVGAPGYDRVHNNETAEQAGAIFLFDGSSPNASPVAEGKGGGDELGIAVAVNGDGNTIIAGARQGGSATGRGKVYSLRKVQKWNLEELPCGQSVDLRLGTSVAIDEPGETGLVGAPGADTTLGSVYLFQLSKSLCIRVPACAGAQQGSRFGQSVALRGASAAIGAPLDPVESADDAGSVCALDLTGIDVVVPEFPKSVTPGKKVAFTIEVKNTSSTPESGKLTVAFDATKLFDVELKCTEGNACSCKEGCSPAIGRLTASAAESGTISATVTDLAKGESVVFTFTASVKPDASGDLGIKIDFDVSSGLDVTLPAKNPVPPTLDAEADLEIEKKVQCIPDDTQCLADGPKTTVDCARTTRGKCLQYIITVKNSGPSQANQAAVTDVFNLNAIHKVTWSCEARKGARCGKKDGTGMISDRKAFLPLDGVLVYTAIAQTRPDTQVRDLVNIATVDSLVAEDENKKNNKDDVTTILPQADLRTDVSPAPKTIAPSSEAVLSAKISFLNDGPDAVGILGEEGARISAEIGHPDATWTCRAGDTEEILFSGSGNISKSDVALAVNDRIDCTVRAPIGPASRGEVQLIKQAEVNAPPGVLDLDQRNNRATATDLRVTELEPRSELERELTVTLPPDGRLVPGEKVQYSLTLRNVKGSNLLGATLSGSFPKILTDVSWTCGPMSPTATCGPGPVGSVSLPVGTQAQLVISAHISPEARGSLEVSVNVSNPGEAVALDPVSAINLLVIPDPGEFVILDSVSALTVLSPHSVLELTLVAQPTPAVSGKDLGFYLTIENNGPSSLLEAEVSGILPASLTATSWGCGIFGANATCTTGKVDQNPLKGRIFELSVKEVVQYVVITKVAAQPGSTIEVRFDIAPGVDDAISRTNILCEVSVEPLKVVGCHGG